ncbi:hypothetical protein [Achromobacter insolitus]|uniref:hypothetical protein n=1 Tax=Achromobacter insolitus TaxID=217204 RepID=UPI001FC92A31|nr:hypothetical protein [Achromobacter insolitus]
MGLAPRAHPQRNIAGDPHRRRRPDGVLLQSIGGGGGLGGSLGADASSYPILDRIGNHGDNKERLDDENSTYEFGVDVGGTGGTAGHGGNVTVNYAGKIATSGDWADGLVANR